jgi:hypothetical protein
MKTRRAHTWAAVAALPLAFGIGWMGCAADAPPTKGESGGQGPGAGGTGGGGIFTGSGGEGGVFIGPPCDVCEDFPAEPIFDGAAPEDAVTLFGPAGSGEPGGPCVAEPADGTLFPKNWLRPRFRWIPGAGQDLFEVRVQAPNQKNDLVVFTTHLEWKMPKDMWLNFAAHSFDLPITVAVRSLNAAAPGTPLLTEGGMGVAPADAAGSMVYWAAIGEAPPDAWLAGFGVGDEATAVALEVDQVQQGARRDQGGNPRGDGSVTCIGCHTSTPDGDYVIFVDHWPWGNAVAAVNPELTGQQPAFMTPGAAEAMNQPWLGKPTTSPGHYAPGDRIFVTSYGRNGGQIWDGSTHTEQPSAELAWFDLETAQPPGPVAAGQQGGTELAATQGTSFGIIARTGDPRGAMVPDWSTDGSTLVYVSTNAGKDGRLATGTADLYTVPYNDKAGGAASPVPGAAEAAYNEYYPEFSPDDRLIAFNRIGSGLDMYYNPTAEVFVIPAGGGSAHRLAGNDPPACLGKTSPGLTNSWAKWAPEATSVNGKTYYWLIFSSARDGYAFQLLPDKTASQLYVMGVVVDGDQITSYPAIYLWNQPTDTSNHTPAWDVFKLPPVPPPK